MSTPTLPLPPMINCLDGFLAIIRRLREHFGVSIVTAPLDNDVVIWDSPTRTLTIDCDSPLEDQLWGALQFWQMCSIGPHTTPDAEPMPRLRLVGI